MLLEFRTPKYGHLYLHELRDYAVGTAAINPAKVEAVKDDGAFDNYSGVTLWDSAKFVNVYTSRTRTPVMGTVESVTEQINDALSRKGATR